jgi:hypothetical protein
MTSKFSTLTCNKGDTGNKKSLASSCRYSHTCVHRRACRGQAHASAFIHTTRRHHSTRRNKVPERFKSLASRERERTRRPHEQIPASDFEVLFSDRHLEAHATLSHGASLQAPGTCFNRARSRWLLDPRQLYPFFIPLEPSVLRVLSLSKPSPFFSPLFPLVGHFSLRLRSRPRGFYFNWDRGLSSQRVFLCFFL